MLGVEDEEPRGSGLGLWLTLKPTLNVWVSFRGGNTTIARARARHLLTVEFGVIISMAFHGDFFSSSELLTICLERIRKICQDRISVDKFGVSELPSTSNRP